MRSKRISPLRCLAARFGLGLCAGLAAPSAFASDTLRHAPVPSWVVPIEAPPAVARDPRRPSQTLLTNDQDRLGPDGTDYFTETVTRIQTPQGLSDAGAVQIEWNPETETPIVHKLLIHRDGKTIDSLAGGQDFTIARRESNLDDDVIDGRLTAVIEPEGLRVGDIVDFAYTVHYHDPVLGHHAEALIRSALWSHPNRLFIRTTWPLGMPMAWRQTEGLAQAKWQSGPDGNALTIDMNDADPPLTPDQAPRRYRNVGQLQMSDFADWDDLAALFAPFYARASAVPPDGAVAAEAAHIRALSPDPIRRAEAALRLVQDKVRYVFLAINGGGYRPAAATLTWQRRFGDCKAKTALLLALLHALDIDAMPALVSTDMGDGLDERLPAAGWFDHVLVRAAIGGKIYWLDGTRTGDRHLAELAVPPYHFALPLRPAPAALDPSGLAPPTLEPLIMAPLDTPKIATTVRIDARGGLFVPAPARIEMVMTGETARWFKRLGETTSYRDIKAELETKFRGLFDLRAARGLNYTYDDDSGVETVTLDGDIRLDRMTLSAQGDQAIRVHGSQVQPTPEFNREPGPHDDAPFPLDFPDYTTLRLTMALPDRGWGFTMGAPDIDRTVAGTVLHRSGRLDGGILTLSLATRTLAREIPAAEALRANDILADMAQDMVVVKVPGSYPSTARDYAALNAMTLSDPGELLLRGAWRLDRKDYAGTIADMKAVLAQAPDQARAYAIRGVAEFCQGVRAQATADLDHAAALDPHDAWMWRGRGMMAHAQGQYAQAAADFTNVLATEPDNVTILAARAFNYDLVHDYDKQIADYDRIIRIYPHLWLVAVARWEALDNQGKAAIALREADAAIAAEPRAALAHFGRAEILRALGRKPEAIGELDATLAIAPLADAYLLRAACREPGDTDAALRDIGLAIATGTDHFVAYMARGRLYLRVGRQRPAIGDFTQAIALNPNYAMAFYLRAHAYESLHQAEPALADMDVVVSLQPDNAAWLNDRCWMKATLAKLPQAALPDCTAALLRDPADAAALDSRGFVYLQLNQFDRSIADYNAALRLRPKAASSLFGRAIAELRKGDRDAAQKDLAAARVADPTVEALFAGFGIKV